MADLTLVCPNCGSEDLATSETISGSAVGRATFDINTGERTFDHSGWTEVAWDSSESTGVECPECFWTQDAAQDGPAYEELLTKKEWEAKHAQQSAG